MNDSFMDHKQQLLRNVFQAFKKIEFELKQNLLPYQEVQKLLDTDAQSNQIHYSSEQITTATFDDEQADKNLGVITDTGELEKRILEYISFYEKHFAPIKRYVQESQFSLLKRAMFTLRYIQHITEQYKYNPTAMPQFPTKLAETSCAAPIRDDISDISSVSGAVDKESVSPPPLRRVPRDQRLLLSFAQQRVWFLHHMEASSSAYTIAGAIRFQGQLHHVALEQSLNEIIRRHEVLRTSFTEYGKYIVQTIVSSSCVVLPCVDLRCCSSHAQAIEITRLASAEAELPFDLQQVPLIRGMLLYLNKQEHVLLLTIHHIAFDGWSLGVFLRELASLYKAFSQGEASPLPELPIQYVDYAQWQHTWLRGEVLERLESYWRRALAGGPTSLLLPTDRPRTSGSSSAGATYSFRVPDLHPGLRQLAQQEHVTFFMLLLAAFQALLYRWSGQEDFIVGTDVANRTRSETEGLIGFFVNLLALRTRIAGNISFQSYLQQVREQVVGAFVHQAFPFEKLIEMSHIQRNEGQVPLVQVLFVLQNTRVTYEALPGLTLSVSELPQTYAKFDMAMFVEERAQGLAGTITYRTALFEESTIQSFVGWFATLLTEIAERPQTSLDALQIYTHQEQEQFSMKEKIFSEEKSKKVKIAKRRIIQIIR